MRTRLAAAVRRTFRWDFVAPLGALFGGSALVSAFNYAFHFALSRRLGVADYGALSSLIAAILLSSVCTSAISVVAVKYASELSRHAQPGGLRTFVERFTRVVAVLGLGLLVLATVARGPLAAFLRIGDPRNVAIMGGIVGANLVFGAARGVLQGVQDFRGLSWSMVVEASAKSLFAVVLVDRGLGLLGAVAGYGIGVLAGLGYTLAALRPHLGRVRAPLRLSIRALLRAMGTIAMTTLAGSLLGFADVVLVKHFFSPQLAGYFGAVALVGKAFLSLGGMVSAVVLPRAAAHASSGHAPRAVLAQGALVLAAIVAPALVALWFFPATILRGAAGPAYVSAAPYLFPYACAMAFLAATVLVTSYKLAIHRFDFVAPLAAVATAEVVGIWLAHRDLRGVVEVALVCQIIALACSLYRVTAPTFARVASFRIGDAEGTAIPAVVEQPAADR